jgi:alpha-1,6-mannosyltransferase
VKIVQVANFVSPTSGGLRTTLRHLAEGYAQQGHEVIQLVPAKTDGRVEYPWGTQLQLRGAALAGTGYRILLDVRRVQRELSTLRPEALEVHDRTTLRGLGVWARRCGVPALAVSHERLDRWLNQWLPARLPLENLADRSNGALARSFDTIVCTTKWAAAEFHRIGAANVVMVPLGVDHEAFRPRFEPTGGDGTLLVMASRLSREKQPEIAVEAVRELVRRRLDVRLIVAGDGPLRRRLEEASAGLPVNWLGFVSSRDALADLYRAADVALAPGPVETFGLAALEAMACGTPAVVNWRSALPEIIGPYAGRTSAGSGFSFADAVEQLLAEPAGELRHAARARAKGFSWDTTVAGLLAVHESRLGGRLAA